MEIGKLYDLEGDNLLVEVDYEFHSKSPTNLWGELVPSEYVPIEDGGNYTIEFKDGRKARCSLRKRVNKAVWGVPPLYHYMFKVTRIL